MHRQAFTKEADSGRISTHNLCLPAFKIFTEMNVSKMKKLRKTESSPELKGHKCALGVAVRCSLQRNVISPVLCVNVGTSPDEELNNVQVAS